jgi:hypothetical protein
MTEEPKELMPEKIIKRFKDERARVEFAEKDPSLSPPGNARPEPAADDEYRTLCNVLGKNILPAELLSEGRAYITRNWNRIIRDFPTGGKCCLSVMPFTDDGHLLPADQAKNGSYVRLLYIGNDKLTHYFSYYPGHYFELLPDFVRDNCTFDAPKIESPQDLFTAQKKFLDDYTAAFNKLRQFFDLDPHTTH